MTEPKSMREVREIRLKLQEKRKNMTISQQTEAASKGAAEFARKNGYNIVPSPTVKGAFIFVKA